MVALVATGALVLTAAACGTSSSPAALTRRVGLQLPITRGAAPASTTTTTLPPPTTAPPTTVPTTIVPAPGWTVPLATLPPGGGFTSVSCISDTFCIAAGGGANFSDASGTVGAGETQSWDGQAWSNPSVYFPPPAAAAGSAGSSESSESPIMPAITCIGGPFCIIVDGSGFVSNGDGTNWITPVALQRAAALPANPADPGSGHPGARDAAVSCPSSKFCAIVDNTGNAFAWENGAWLTPQAFGTGAAAPAAMYASGRVGVSCATSSSCTAVIGTAVLNWGGKTWSEEPAPWSPSLSGSSGSSAINGNPTAISCPTTTLCAIVNGSGVSSRNNSTTWSPVQTIDPGSTLDAISCPQASFCMAADADGSIVTWDGTSWAPPVRVIPAATNYTGIGTSVSCSSAGFCMVINGDGDYATFSDSAIG
jgi:ferredoxin